MANKHTIIYQSHFELMDNLSDEQAGILIKSIGLFQKGIEPKITDPLVMGIFLAIKRDFIIQSENYAKKVKANQENGAKGGRPKVSINPNNPVGLSITQPNPQNLKDKDKDIDKDNSNIPGNASVNSFKPITTEKVFDSVFND